MYLLLKKIILTVNIIMTINYSLRIATVLTLSCSPPPHLIMTLSHCRENIVLLYVARSKQLRASSVSWARAQCSLLCGESKRWKSTTLLHDYKRYNCYASADFKHFLLLVTISFPVKCPFRNSFINVKPFYVQV